DFFTTPSLTLVRGAEITENCLLFVAEGQPKPVFLRVLGGLLMVNAMSPFHGHLNESTLWSG
ncbi:MAG: hypothetical protein PHG96_13950, partial [Kiritimatiellae bacterium]|nr:hypothetical protein [Kiritimatiellia bacterium]